MGGDGTVFDGFNFYSITVLRAEHSSLSCQTSGSCLSGSLAVGKCETFVSHQGWVLGWGWVGVGGVNGREITRSSAGCKQ